MVQLILYGILALGAIAALWGAYDFVGDYFRDPVIAEYEPRLKAANDRTDAAIDANDLCRTSIIGLEGKVVSQNKAMDDLQTRTAKAHQAAIAALGLAAAAARSKDADIQRLMAIASGPPTPGGKDDQCQTADDILSDLARERLRDARPAETAK